jgi:uncharacterized protein with FMN-binding domain
MKKIIVAAIIIVTFVLYSFTHAHSEPVAVTPNTSSSSRSTSALMATPTPEATASATSTASTPGALYKDGTYTGSVADAQWGVVQVQTVIKDGKITSVRFLQYPDDRNRSIEINGYADPQLVSEAIQAQSARVDIVTGATDTSEAFIQSLSDALSQARA